MATMPFADTIRLLASDQLVDETPPTLASENDLTVAEGARVTGSLRSGGTLHVGAHAIIEGSAEAAEARLGDEARVTGALIVSGPVEWGDGARVGRARVRGRLTTSDGVVRAASVIAARGIRPTDDAEGSP